MSWMHFNDSIHNVANQIKLHIYVKVIKLPELTNTYIAESVKHIIPEQQNSVSLIIFIVNIFIYQHKESIRSN